ncbi:MAG: hypothetical protein HP059_12685 [Clostridium sp.]|nr:hypothetical protein [Clostridium sp.]
MDSHEAVSREMLDEKKADEAITIYQSRFPDLKMAASLKSKLKVTEDS